MIASRKSQALIAALLVVAGIGSWQLAQQPATEAGEEKITLSNSGRAIDYYADDFVVTTMTMDGKPARRLEASRMRHYLDDDTTELDSPYLKVFKTETPPWNVTSEQGWISSDGNLVLLTGHTVMDRKGSESHAPLHLVSSNVRIQPDQDYAETDEPVTVISGPNRIDSIGMQAWLREPNRFKFLSKVKGHYVSQ